MNFFTRHFIQCCKQLQIQLLDPEFSKDENFMHNWNCKICNRNFTSSWNSIQLGKGCPKCSIPGFSYIEIQLKKFLEKFDTVVDEPDNTFCLPNKKFRFKIIKMYWFGEDHLDQRTHINVLENSEKENFRFIHIFEDEWIFKKKICKTRIKQLLHENDAKRIHARKCFVTEINSRMKNLFLDEFHIQGKDNARIKLGAIYNDQIISVMTFGLGNISKGLHKEKNIWELNRFVSDSYFRIPGIASKMLKYFMRNYSWETIFSFADRKWSDANLYKKIGFRFLYNTNPSYWYVKRGSFQRLHRFGLRKRSDEPRDVTEMYLRFQEGYIKFWDCGNVKLEIRKEFENV